MRGRQKGMWLLFSTVAWLSVDTEEELSKKGENKIGIVQRGF